MKQHRFSVLGPARASPLVSTLYIQAARTRAFSSSALHSKNTVKQALTANQKLTLTKIRNII